MSRRSASQGRLDSRSLAFKRRAWRWMRKSAFMGGGFAAFCVCATGWWYYHTGRFQHQLNVIEQTRQELAMQVSALLSMHIDQIYLEGRERMPKDEALAAIGVERGDLTLSVHVQEVKNRLENSRWVDYAEVQRTLPGTLHVRIIERQPLALWQYQGTLHLIDHRGRPIEGEDIANYSYLPVIVGNTAPDKAYELMQALTSAPDLFARVSAAVLVNGRRWNVRLYNGMEIMLPESQPERAWQRLAQLEETQKVLERSIATLDMRQRGKLYVRLTDGTEPTTTDGKTARSEDI